MNYTEGNEVMFDIGDDKKPCRGVGVIRGLASAGLVFMWIVEVRVWLNYKPEYNYSCLTIPGGCVKLIDED